MNSYKAVFLGEGRVGKTSIGLKWSRNEFDPQRKSTVQAGLYTKKVETSMGIIELNLWDTAGQEEYHAVAPIYYKGAQAALLVYSVVDQKSFDRIIQWHKELTQGVEFAQSIGCNHFEVSAKTGEGIDMLFRYLTETLVKTVKPNSKQTPRGRKGFQVVDAEEKPEEEKGGCCS